MAPADPLTGCASALDRSQACSDLALSLYLADPPAQAVAGHQALDLCTIFMRFAPILIAP